MSLGLKKIVEKKLASSVFECDSFNKNEKRRVLIMDCASMKIVSSCFRMHQIVAKGVTLVENLMINREPLPKLEAIYLMQPTSGGIDFLINDFLDNTRKKYKSAHVFFIETCSDYLINKLAKSKASKYVKTLREIDVSYVPNERLVFSLETSDTFKLFFSQNHQRHHSPTNDETSSIKSHLLSLAEQISTLCLSLDERPLIRYSIGNSFNRELASLVKKKLEQEDFSNFSLINDELNNSSLNTSFNKVNSQLIIIDRSFDVISPLLHELTFQAMVYDLLNINNDTYTFSNQGSLSPSSSSTYQNGKPKEVVLNEDDTLWTELRHKHIAEVTQTLTSKLKSIIDITKSSDNKKLTLKELGKMIQNLPKYREDLHNYSTYLHILEECYQMFDERIKLLCEIEQNLVMGTDSHGEKIKDQMKNITTIIFDDNAKLNDKLRLACLYFLFKNGKSQEYIENFLNRAKLPNEKLKILLNMEKIGAQILNHSDKESIRKNIPQNRKQRLVGTYQLSRWTPVVKDIMEDVLQDKLDIRLYPFVSDEDKLGSSFIGSSSVRPSWHRYKNQSNVHTGPRLIVFVIGGISYSEIRSAYEVTAQNQTWEVIIGSDQILTPEKFLKNLEDL